ncbi:MAG: hypothetical protein V3V20_07170 [Algisphaera sp.]
MECLTRRIAGGVLVALMLLSAGCRIGGSGKSFVNENDDLRSENVKLSREIDQFQERARLQEAELSTLREGKQGDHPLSGATVPVLSDLKFARYTGPVDTNQDGEDDRLVLYIMPVDQMGRMSVTAGRLNLQAVTLEANTPPRVIADRTYEPLEFDTCYRTGLTGDHYSVQLDLPENLPGDLKTITVQLTLTQAGTGIEVEAQESFRLRRR